MRNSLAKSPKKYPNSCGPKSQTLLGVLAVRVFASHLAMSAPVDKYARMDALIHFGNPTGSYARVKGFLRDRPVPSVDPAKPKPDSHVRIVCISGKLVFYISFLCL